MSFYSRFIAVALLPLFIFFIGCGGEEGGNLTVNLIPSNATRKIAVRSDGPAQNSTAQLESLKYRIRSVQMCQNVEVSGTATTGSSGCLILFQGNDADDYDSFDNEKAAADTTNYIDLMDSTSRARLNAAVTLTSDHLGTYRFGMINWYQPIKVKASVVTLDGNKTLYTKAGTETVVDNQYYATVAGNLSTEPVEEGICRLNNGGSWFKFQKPFVISEADISAKTNFKLDLVFNPEHLITGAPAGVDGGYNPPSFTDLVGGGSGENLAVNNRIWVPFLKLTPIFHSLTQSVMKETYLFHVQETGDKFDIRVELYYVSEDLEKSIYGIDVKSVYTSESTVVEYDPPLVFDASEVSDVVELKDWQNRTYLSFSRLSEAGNAPGQATFTCGGEGGGFQLKTNNTCATFTASYELASVSEVGAE